MTPVTLSEEGELSAAELARGCRLACLTEPLSDCRVHVPGESVTALQRTQLEGLEVPAEVDRSVVNCVVQMALPTLDGLRGDDQRICEAASAAAGLDTALPDLEVARGAYTELSKLGWRARVTLRGRKYEVRADVLILDVNLPDILDPRHPFPQGFILGS